MAGWTDDPELVAVFRAEVEEKLTALRDGLLRLPAHAAPRQLVGSLFRDAHTVKGSARALDAQDVVVLAHRLEEVLGSLRDGRFLPRPDLVELMLVAVDAIAATLPGAPGVHPDDTAALLATLDDALAGVEPVVPPALRRLGDAATEETGESTRGRGDTVVVATRRVYDLLDVVGEAELEARRVDRAVARLAARLTERSAQLTATGADGARPSDQAGAWAALVEELGESVRELRHRSEASTTRLGQVREGSMGLAMVPLRRVTQSFTAMVHRDAAAAGKDVTLVVDGADVELDVRVLEGVADALRHLVANAVAHGCEPTAVRTAAGKSARGTVTVRARTAGSSVVIEVSDDGAGVDEEAVRAAAVTAGLIAPGTEVSGPALHALLFHPGLSTAAQVDETAGRGVGLDAVRDAVDGLGGALEVRSVAGVGTTVAVTLPVTLGVLRCLVARVGGERYALPVTAVIETVALDADVTEVVAGAVVLHRHGAAVPLVDLGAALGVPGGGDPRAAVVVRYGGATELLAWGVDALEGEAELVVKELGPFLGRVPALAGATVDSDGMVLLVLDVRELALARLAGGPTSPVAALPAPAPARRPRVLVVEDSVGVRELERVILEKAGYTVETAVDGGDGAARLAGSPVDLVVSDVEMPGMDGFTLTRTLRATSGWEDVPVVIMTSRGSDADRRAGLDAGASAYLLKSTFDQAELVDTVRRLVGR